MNDEQLRKLFEKDQALSGAAELGKNLAALFRTLIDQGVPERVAEEILITFIRKTIGS